MLVYRVFPYLAEARPGEPGHPDYVHPEQGSGRLDNPDLYLVRYLTTEPSAAIGETFAHLTYWNRAMLRFPGLPGARRVLGVYSLDEEAVPLLNLDDARVLLERNLRPTQVIERNRPATQAWARRIYEEQSWDGVRWWSYHRPQSTILGVWREGAIHSERTEDLWEHPAFADAARALAKLVIPAESGSMLRDG
ncbi:MAG: RES family NAD+ phosphorylase [Candidatus Dormiibacterota bacterium]